MNYIIQSLTFKAAKVESMRGFEKLKSGVNGIHATIMTSLLVVSQWFLNLSSNQA